MRTKLVPAALSMVVIAVFCCTAIPAHAQAVYGTVYGTITDAQGAAVPGAAVTVTDVNKGVNFTTTTNDTGNYTVSHLVPGVYQVKAEAKGFKTFEAKDIQVLADVSSHVDGQLQVGSSGDTVTVSADEVPLVKTDRADVATTFTEKAVEDLPVLNRNFTTFELLSPGTQKLVGWSHAATENPQGSQQIFVNGQHFSGTAFELDGTDNQDPILGIIVVNPNLDAITETKMTLQNYDAEFGKAVAGVVTVQTKSGTNALHGGGFWFRRTDALQARNPFTQFQADPITHKFIPPDHWNQFGGSLGGPIVKDKLFFFTDFQGTRETTGVTQVLNVPTTLVESTCTAATGVCDLSQYLGHTGGGGQVYDPNTGNALNGSGRTAFAGNLIPVSRLSPQAVAILKLFPAPNAPGTNGGIIGNYVASGSGKFSQNAWDTRIDYTASSSMTVFGRFSLDYFNLSGQPALGALGGIGFGPGPGLAGSSITHNYSLATGVNKVISSTLLTDVRFGYFKYNPQTHKWDEGKTPATTFGIPGLNAGNTATSGLPAFYMDSPPGSLNGGPNNGATVSDFGDGLNVNRCNCPLTESEQQFQIVNNWTKMKGNHQIKFGADLRYAENLRVPSDANRTGQLNFNHLTTSNGGAGGLALATLLLGDVSFFDRFASQTLTAAERQKRMFYYGQDTWRITPKFTFNYGLRWEVYFPETINNPGQGGLANIEQGVIRVGGVGPYATNFNINNDWHAFAPRLGMAYEITPKTVVRLGYGRSFDIGVFGSNFGHVVSQNLPVLVHQNIGASAVIPGATDNNVTAFTLASGPPAVVYPTVPSNGALPLRGLDGTVDPRIRPTTQRLPTLDAWNLTVQHQISGTMSLEMAYIGNKGTHVFAGNGPAYNVNQPWITGFPTVPQNQRRPFFNKFTYPGYSYTDATGTHATPACCSSDLGNYFGNDASSNYNALQVKVTKRYNNGLEFLAHYTWSRAMNYDSNYYVDNPRIAYGPDDYNRRHVFVWNVVYDLPFGKGKMFASNANKLEDLIVGGWRLSSTTNWSSGLPFNISTSGCNAQEDVGVCRPNKGSGTVAMGVGSFNNSSGSPFIQYFTPLPTLGGTGPYTAPAIGTLGNAGRNQWIGPRLFTTDLSAAKTFNVTERFKTEFRADFFNVFNHPVLATPNNACIDCSGAGQITNIEADTNMREVQFGLRVSF